jgi:hypothetical protein
MCGIGSNGMFVTSKPQGEYKLLAVKPPSFCIEGGDVIKAGQYNKTLCVIEFAQNYENSRTACAKYGMRLFRLDSPESKNQIISFATTKYSSFSINVNGRSSAGCVNLNNNDGVMKVQSLSCESLSYGACEFIKERK